MATRLDGLLVAWRLVGTVVIFGVSQVAQVVVRGDVAPRVGEKCGDLVRLLMQTSREIVAHPMTRRAREPGKLGRGG